jgi:hypothetical protein
MARSFQTGFGARLRQVRPSLDIALAEQGTFVIEASISPEDARGRAATYKGSAFGALAQLFSKPKPDDVAVEARGLRYEPFWHATCHVRIVYDRRETYRFAVKTPDHVASISFGDATYPVEAGTIAIPALAHCVRDRRQELWIDAASGETVAARTLDPAKISAVELEHFPPPGAEVVQPTVRASAVVRQLLGSDTAPIEADSLSESRADVERLDLYFRPVYPFTLSWAAKGKSVDIVLDAMTGEIATVKGGLHPVLGRLLHKDVLFDIGSETLNLVVPGASIPLRLVEALSRKREPH